MPTRRDVVRTLIGASAALPLVNRTAFASIREANTVGLNCTPRELAGDEDFRGPIQRAVKAGIA